jgi:hypothetical protein
VHLDVTPLGEEQDWALDAGAQLRHCLLPEIVRDKSSGVDAETINAKLQ